MAISSNLVDDLKLAGKEQAELESRIYTWIEEHRRGLETLLHLARKNVSWNNHCIDWLEPTLDKAEGDDAKKEVTDLLEQCNQRRERLQAIISRIEGLSWLWAALNRL